MWPIEKRCQQRDTNAFVAPDTVDLLGEKLIGLIGDRRMTKMDRYLGDNPGRPRLMPGLRVWHGGLAGPVTVTARRHVGIMLARIRFPFEGIGLGVGREDETEEQAQRRYHHPENEWLGQRRDITYVELDGWPGSPRRDDSIRIEHWNSHGVGSETIIVFDDLDLVEELAWDIKGDKERLVHLDDAFCDTHNRHFEDPQHEYQSGCALRASTLAENLQLLADLAKAVKR